MKSTRRIDAATPAFQRRAVWLCALAGISVAAISAGAGLLSGHAQSSPAQDTKATQQAATTPPNSPNPAAAAQSMPASAPAAAAGDPQKQEIVDEAADLLKLATALKSEVDKSNKDTLSVTVVRKAGQLEQLAHKARTGPGKS
jgi:type VI protein secretion system component VasF